MRTVLTFFIVCVVGLISWWVSIAWLVEVLESCKEKVFERISVAVWLLAMWAMVDLLDRFLFWSTGTRFSAVFGSQLLLIGWS